MSWTSSNVHVKGNSRSDLPTPPAGKDLQGTVFVQNQACLKGGDPTAAQRGDTYTIPVIGPVVDGDVRSGPLAKKKGR